MTLVLTQVISVASLIWIARLLSPTEVGVYTAGTVLAAFLTSFTEGGLRLALVQREHDLDDAADTVFWATAAAGVVGCLVSLGAAPILGHLFGSDLVAAVAVSTSGLFLLESLTNVPDGLMQRRFNFLRKLVVDPARALAYAAVTIALAASGFGVWSMVVGQYAAVAVWVIGSWSLGRWRPGRGRPSMRLWRELARFSYPLAIANIVFNIRESAQVLIVGRSLGDRTLGNYRYGMRIGMLPGNATFQIGSYVLFPAFSRFTNDPNRFRAAFLRSLRWIWLAAAPVAAIIVALGKPIVVVVLGARWSDAGMLLVALSGVPLGQALQAVANDAIKAAGRSALIHWTSATELVLGIGLVVVMLPFGLTGVGVAISVTEIICGIVPLVLAKPIVGYRVKSILRLLHPPLIAAAAGMLAVLTMTASFGLPIGLPTVTAVGVLVGYCVVLLVVYVAVIAMLDRRALIALAARLAR